MLDRPDPSNRTQADLRRRPAPRKLKRNGIIAAIVAVLVVAAGLTIRFYSSQRTAAWTEAQATPTVQTLTLKNDEATGDLTLPGDIRAFTNAPIYAQVNGYVKKWNADIGTRVKAGDVLAEIDSKPYEASLAQAKGQMARDSATLANAKLDLVRDQQLIAAGGISQQQLSTQHALVNSDQGVVTADQAAVETAQINLGYTRIIAPFDGIVTSRAVDVGTLVTPGASSGMPLFTVTDEKKLRVYVNVPQADAPLITSGMTAHFTVPELPGRNFTTQLAATADAITSQSGTQLVQLQIDNTDGALKPGDYAEVHFALPPGLGVIRLPATALLFRDNGMIAATLDAHNRVVMKPVTIRRDLGTAVEIGSGLNLNDRVIDNPPDSLQQGDEVRVAAAPATVPAAN
jgi:RND family efflux transporter MFP subunit